MANTGQIVRDISTDNFTHLPNDITRSKDLSLEEKGMLSYLLGLPSDWIIYKKDLYNKLSDKEGTIDRVFKSLQEKGYIISKKVCDNKGHFVGWNHVVFNNPKPDIGETRQSENPTVGKPDLGQSAPILNTNNILNTNLTKISCSEKIQNDTDFKIIKFEISKESTLEEKIIKNFHSLFCDFRAKPGKPFTHKILNDSKMGEWAKELDAIMRIDKKTREDLLEVYDFLKKGEDKFWRETISSLSGIRKHYDKIVDKMNAEKEKKKIKPQEAKEGVFQGNINRVTKSNGTK